MRARRPPALRSTAIAAFAAALAAPVVARASGFLLHEQSAQAIGRAGAVTASTREPAAVWFNPAALAFLPGAGVSLTGTLAHSGTRFSPGSGGADVRSKTGFNVVPSVFAHVAVNDRIAVGFGVYAPFGLAVVWPDGWVGAQQSLQTRLYAVAANPVVACRLSERLALAAGVSAYRAGVHFLIDLPPEAGGRADMEGSAWGLGWNLSAHFRLRPEVLHLAASYHSRATLDFEGDADFSPTNGVFADLFTDQPARTSVTLPDVITVAALWRPRPRLELALEVTHVRWSTFERLTIDFERGGTPDIPIERGTGNPFTVRVGGETWLQRAPVALRAGVFLDQSASSRDTLAPSAPDGHRLGLSAGAGYALGRARLDLGYLFAHFLPSESSAPQASPDKYPPPPPRGTYRTRIHALSLTVTVTGLP
jgi:long-chain fatty acid transport protein